MSQKARLFPSGRAKKTASSSTPDLPLFQDLLYRVSMDLTCFLPSAGSRIMSNWMNSLLQAQDGCLQMVAHRASMGRVQQEQLAQNVAQRATMPSKTDQVTYLRAQLAHRDAQLEQVCTERDNHFVQEEEEVLAHMRLLSSEAKDLEIQGSDGSRGSAVEKVPKLHIKLPKAREAMVQHYKAKWRQAQEDLQALCQSNSAQTQCLASKLQETNLEHHGLYTAQERQLRLEAESPTTSSRAGTTSSGHDP